MKKIPGVVLAGGRSKRFGDDKRFYKIAGKPLLEITIEKLKKDFDEIYIVCDDKAVLEEGLGRTSIEHTVIIEDIKRFNGPLMGIYTFFRETKEQAGFFMPVDMPFFPLKLIEYFKIKGLETMVFISEERALPSLFCSKILPDLENYLKKEKSIKGFIEIIKDKYPDDFYFLSKSELLTFGNPVDYLKNINKRTDLY